MGVYAVSRSAPRVPVGQHFGFDELVLDLLGRGTTPSSYPFDGYWLDIGRPDDYDRANKEFAELASRLLPRGVHHAAGDCPPIDTPDTVPGQNLTTQPLGAS